MSTGLLNQLRSYYDSVDENQRPIRPEEVSVLLESVRELSSSEVPVGDGHVRPLEPLPLRRGTQPYWVVAAAVAAVVLIIVVPVLWLAGGTQPEVGGTGSDAAASVPATTAFQESASFAVSEWTRVPHDEEVFGGAFAPSMNGVTAGGPGLVAVGTDGTEAAVWVSIDGASWLRVPHEEQVFGSGDTEVGMASVTAGGPGLVAVGWEDTLIQQDVEDIRAAVWTSPDGITWSRVPHDDSVLAVGDTFGMASVTVGGPGLVAVGAAQHGPHTSAAVWISNDGTSWLRVPHVDEVFGPVASGGLATGMVRVIAGGPGLVAVGWERIVDHWVPAVWTSSDGIAWSRVPHDDEVFAGWRGGISGVTVGGPGLVAVGVAAHGRTESDAAVWTSVDGITWSRVPHDDVIFGGEDDQKMASVTTAGSGLVAVGFDGSSAVVWTSPDGITWSRVPRDQAVFGGAGMVSVTATAHGLVAVGSGDGGAAVWVAAAED